MDLDQDTGGSQAGSDAAHELWMQTRAGKRVSELQQVEENIAALLHFAGCTLAALHPDPLSSFTSREIAVEKDDDDEAGEDGDGNSAPSRPKKPTPRNAEEAKLAEFGKYAEGYYATLNDIQLALRTSIRHLRVSRVSARPLTDPAYASLAYRPSATSSTGTGSGSSGAESVRVGPGGVALDLDQRMDQLRKQESTLSTWDSRSARLPAGDLDGRIASSDASRAVPLSVDALELERDALRDLVAALESASRVESS